MTFAEAIAKEEGFGVPNSRPTRNNNPGDLEFHDWQKQFGGVLETIPSGRKQGRFAYFPTAEQGFAALKHLLGFPIYRGKTVEEALNIWAPPFENQTNSYIKNVCLWAKCEPTDVIDSLL